MRCAVVLMMNKKQHLEDFFNDIPEHFDILESGISESVQKAYIQSAKKCVLKDRPETILKASKNLFDPDSLSAAKKKILINLAHLGTVEAYRIIEKYVKSAGDEELKEWDLLSLRECRMFLESDLTEESKGFVSTGLGGEGNRLRYYFVIGSKDGLPFSQRQNKIIEQEFADVCRKHSSLIEEIEFQQNYSLPKALIPMDKAVGDVIEEGIKLCDGGENFLDVHYYVTNVKKPGKKDNGKYLRERDDAKEEKRSQEKSR